MACLRCIAGKTHHAHVTEGGRTSSETACADGGERKTPIVAIDRDNPAPIFMVVITGLAFYDVTPLTWRIHAEGWSMAGGMTEACMVML